MTLTRHRASLVGLYLGVLVGLAACSDDPDGKGGPADSGADAAVDVGPDAPPDPDAGPRPDTRTDFDAGPGSDADAGPSADTGPDMNDDAGPATGFRLRGELVPTGGLSLSNSFTLSGHLNPGMPEQSSSSANFRLKLTPAPTTTGN